jgi:hypothetical protein
LGVIDGATHMNFAGVGLSQNTERLSLQLIRDFLRGLLLGDCTQQANLLGLNLTVK